jgi:hypothetical protein
MARFTYKKDISVSLPENKHLWIGIAIFMIGVLMCSIYHPIRFSVFASESSTVNDTSGSLRMYFINSINFLVCATCLLLPALFEKKKYYLLLFIVFAFIMYIALGFRFRIVYILISLTSMYHLYFKKKIKLLVWIPVGLSFFLLMGLMTTARTYGSGLRRDQIEAATLSQMAEGANVEAQVFYLSGNLMKKVEDKDTYIYFEPITTAIMMPVPRAWYADKPDGKYLLDAQEWMFGHTFGAAFLIYAEAFFAFGWIGIILNGLFMGWLSKYFWLRFLNNRFSFNSILLLSLYNGYIYFMLSRGYLAAQCVNFAFFIVIPYFLYKKISNRKKKNNNL